MLKRYLARGLLKYSMEELWEILEGPFILLFDNGAEVVTNARETLYSAYTWEFHRRYPQTLLLPKHHLATLLDGKRLGSDTHLKLLGFVMWDVYDTYVSDHGHLKDAFATLPEGRIPEVKFRDCLAKLIYQTTNEMYNDLTYRLEEYVVSLDITDIIATLHHPRIREANRNAQPTEESIEETYNTIQDVLMNGVDMPFNPVSLAARSGVISMGQVKQSIGPRGFLTDTDSYQFPKPVMTGYVEGIVGIYESGVETRSAAKSLTFAKAPLQDAEYFARRLQLVTQIVTTLAHGDCGTTEYMSRLVRPTLYDGKVVKRRGDLGRLVGKNYIDDDGTIKVIRAHHTHLIGRTLKLRAVGKCAHPVVGTICSTCFGDLSMSVPEHTNIGHMCCTNMSQKSSQIVLSVKHHDGSAAIEGIELTPDMTKYLRVHSDKNSYLLSDDLLKNGGKVELVIHSSDARNLTDLKVAKQIEDLNITRVTELDRIGIIHTRGNVVTNPALKVSKGSRRLASLTHAALHHIHKHEWTIDEDGNYRIDMTGWDYSKPVLTLPLRHANMSDHSKDIALLLESSVKNMQERDIVIRPEALLLEFDDLVNDKLNVNFAVLEVVMYGTQIVSAESKDYSLPKPWTPSGFGVMENTMKYRSYGPLMAYEQHRNNLYSPSGYLVTNRPDHPIDFVLCPREMIEAGVK